MRVYRWDSNGTSTNWQTNRYTKNAKNWKSTCCAGLGWCWDDASNASGVWVCVIRSDRKSTVESVDMVFSLISPPPPDRAHSTAQRVKGPNGLRLLMMFIFCFSKNHQTRQQETGCSTCCLFFFSLLPGYIHSGRESITRISIEDRPAVGRLQHQHPDGCGWCFFFVGVRRFMMTWSTSFLLILNRQQSTRIVGLVEIHRVVVIIIVIWQCLYSYNTHTLMMMTQLTLLIESRVIYVRDEELTSSIQSTTGYMIMMIVMYLLLLLYGNAERRYLPFLS